MATAWNGRLFGALSGEGSLCLVPWRWRKHAGGTNGGKACHFRAAAPRGQHTIFHCLHLVNAREFGDLCFQLVNLLPQPTHLFSLKTEVVVLGL